MLRASGIDYNTKNLLKLSVTRIQVNAKSIPFIPAILHLKVKEQWIPVQLGPVFTQINDSRPVEECKAIWKGLPQTKKHQTFRTRREKNVKLKE